MILQYIVYVHIAGCDDSDIHCDFVFPSQRSYPFLLNGSQYLPLGRCRHCIDFIEKECAFVRDFKETFFFLRICEASAFYTEKNTFQEIFGQSSAVDVDKLSAASSAGIMYYSGRHLLAGTCFSCQQHRRFQIRDLAEFSLEFLHHRR